MTDLNKEAQIKRRFANLSVNAIPVRGIKTEKLQLMRFQDTLLGAVRTAISKTAPLHGAE